MIHHLTRLGIIQQDTLVVGTHPIIAPLILAGRSDITQFHTLQTGMSRDILVHTILIRTDPYAAIIGLTNRTEGIIADRAIVIFIVQELLPLIVLHVDDHQSIVVAYQP